MLKRAIFGAIYVAIILGGILGGPFLFLLLMLLLSTLAINEFMIMVNPASTNATEATVAMLQRSLDCVGAAVLIVTLWTGTFFLPGVATYIIYLILRLTIQLWIHGQNTVMALSTSMMSQLYIAVPIALMSVIFRISPHLLLLLFVLVWVNDTFAYLSGCTFGRHKLWERISPKKTWEGFWGGMAMTVIVSIVCALLWRSYFANIGVISMALLGATVCVAATLGDLVESLLKRSVGVKDSGNLIPGHGGILDRIDSILLVIPTAFIFIFFLTYYAI